MNFKKYPSIENLYRKKFIDQIYKEALNGGEWFVTEKVHGANFSILTDGTDVKFAKRTSILKEGKEYFYNWEVLKEYLEEVSKNTFNCIRKNIPTSSIQIFGELYGGSYPHKDVPKIKGIPRVQKGVYYTNELRFYAFDILVSDGEQGYFLDRDTFKDLISFKPEDVAQELFRGTLEECLEFKKEFNSTLPKILGLPELENNICEGVVIAPCVPKFFYNGSRVIIKNRNDKFSEKGPRLPKVVEPLSEEQQGYLDTLLSLLNENRLRNVLSKINGVTDKDFGKIMGLLTKDIMEDFLKDCGGYKKLDKKDTKRIQKALGKEVSFLLREYFLDIIDRTF